LISFLFCAVALPQGSDPKPQDATKAILAAFDKYEVVGMQAAHGFKDLDDYILSLIRHPAFPNQVDDIVVECGNSLYQNVLDRFIAGENVPVTEVRQVWRNTTQLMCSLSGFYEQLIPLVRQVNQKLPAQRRLRMLAADPAFDWSKVMSAADIPRDRDSAIASVMAKEVLANKRRALMLFGVGHLFHGEQRPNAVTIYEQTYPGLTLVINAHHGFESQNEQLEARLKTWPKPSVALIKDTWLGKLGIAYFSDLAPKRWPKETTLADFVDAYLYLGPRDSLTHENTPSDILEDQLYMEELSRRAALGGSFAAFDPARIRERDQDSRLYRPR